MRIPANVRLELPCAERSKVLLVLIGAVVQLCQAYLLTTTKCGDRVKLRSQYYQLLHTRVPGNAALPLLNTTI